MGNFVPHLSHHTEPLRQLLKKDITFYWDDQLTWSFQEIKTLLKRATSKPLGYYDRRKEVIVQADTSLRGLGTCLIQDGKPIVFGSKSLTGAESIRKYRERTAHHCLCLHTVQHLSTRVPLHSSVRPQAPGDDTFEKHAKCASMASENAPAVTKIWHEDRIQTRQRNAAGGWSLKMPHWVQPRNQTRLMCGLHSLYNGLDWEVKRDHLWGPGAVNSVSASTARMAKGEKESTSHSQILLRFQRWVKHRWWFTP